MKKEIKKLMKTINHHSKKLCSVKVSSCVLDAMHKCMTDHEDCKVTRD